MTSSTQAQLGTRCSASATGTLCLADNQSTRASSEATKIQFPRECGGLLGKGVLAQGGSVQEFPSYPRLPRVSRCIQRNCLCKTRRDCHRIKCGAGCDKRGNDGIDDGFLTQQMANVNTP